MFKRNIPRTFICHLKVVRVIKKQDKTNQKQSKIKNMFCFCWLQDSQEDKFRILDFLISTV